MENSANFDVDMGIDIVLAGANINLRMSNETHVTNEKTVNFDGKVIEGSIWNLGKPKN